MNDYTNIEEYLIKCAARENAEYEEKYLSHL